MTTLLDRMIRVGISPEPAMAHIEAGMVRVDGSVVDDPGAEVGDTANIAIHHTPPAEETS